MSLEGQKKGNSTIAIDIFLLAVLLALHVTKTNRNTEMIILILLLVHVVMTTEEPEFNVDVDVQFSPDTTEIPPPPNNLGLKFTLPEVQGGSSEYQRQFNTPVEISKTSNQKMAKARSNFFSDLFRQ